MIACWSLIVTGNPGAKLDAVRLRCSRGFPFSDTVCIALFAQVLSQLVLVICYLSLLKKLCEVKKRVHFLGQMKHTAPSLDVVEGWVLTLSVG
jgi:hypothetical protein